MMRLLGDIFALLGLAPWPSRGNRVSSDEYARKVVQHLKLCGREIMQHMSTQARLRSR
jgi:hypothetical protein